MPSDLRTLLLGWKLRDKDGRKSDLTIYVIVASKLGLDKSPFTERLRRYLFNADAWHRDVGAWHGYNLDSKRWPNILANGGTYESCLRQADRNPNEPQCPLVTQFDDEIRRLRKAVLGKVQDVPNGLWPGSETYFKDHAAQLKKEHNGRLDPHKLEIKLWTRHAQTVKQSGATCCVRGLLS